MLKKLIFIAIFVVIFFTNSYGNETEEGYRLYYYSINKENKWESMEYKFYNNFTKLEKIEYLFNELFTNTKFIKFIPEDVKLISVEIIGDELILNVSEEINNFGGSYYQSKLINQITRTGLSLKNINYVTLHIGGELLPLNEGIVIEKISNWDLSDKE